MEFGPPPFTLRFAGDDTLEADRFLLEIERVFAEHRFHFYFVRRRIDYITTALDGRARQWADEWLTDAPVDQSLQLPRGQSTEEWIRSNDKIWYEFRRDFLVEFSTTLTTIRQAAMEFRRMARNTAITESGSTRQVSPRHVLRNSPARVDLRSQANPVLRRPATVHQSSLQPHGALLPPPRTPHHTSRQTPPVPQTIGTDVFSEHQPQEPPRSGAGPVGLRPSRSVDSPGRDQSPWPPATSSGPAPSRPPRVARKPVAPCPKETPNSSDLIGVDPACQTATPGRYAGNSPSRPPIQTTRSAPDISPKGRSTSPCPPTQDSVRPAALSRSKSDLGPASPSKPRAGRGQTSLLQPPLTEEAERLDSSRLSRSRSSTLKEPARGISSRFNLSDTNLRLTYRGRSSRRSEASEGRSLTSRTSKPDISGPTNFQHVEGYGLVAENGSRSATTAQAPASAGSDYLLQVPSTGSGARRDAPDHLTERSGDRPRSQQAHFTSVSTTPRNGLQPPVEIALEPSTPTRNHLSLRAATDKRAETPTLGRRPSRWERLMFQLTPRRDRNPEDRC